MLDDESSLRLNLLRFPLIVGVVFIHAYSNTVGFAGGDMVVSQTNFVVDFVRNFVSQGVARIAVPLFFLMSGYLFFMGFEWSKESYLIKLQSRIKTLLIPFLFWNIATLLLTAIIQAMPATKMFLSGRSLLVTNYSIFDYLNAIIGLNTLPISYQFWFIRNLIIFILLVPIINLINKTLPIPFLGILLCCWLIGFWTVDILLLEGLLFLVVLNSNGQARSKAL